MADGPAFRGVMTLEGIPTSDKRVIEPNETTWRELPLSLMVMTKASHGGMPSTETVVGGRIDTIERRPVDGGFELYFEGVLNDDEVGLATARLVGNRSLRGVSIDFAAREELEVLEEDEDGFPIDYLLHYTEVEIGMATVCPFPAFEGGYLELAEPLADDAPAEAEAAALVDLVASGKLDPLHSAPCTPCESARASELVAAGGPVDPPAAWFEAPDVDRPTPLTITPDGRVFGHLALWDECHVGIGGKCVTPPRSRTGYSRFRVASVLTAEGSLVPTGTLFMGTAHASTRGGLGIDAVQDHYADTGQATADVAAGEDEHGVWVAGALRPGMTAEQVRAARGSVLSGDWRWHGGGLELVAALHVNVPGFAVPHAELVASGGRPEALVAAGAYASAALARRERTVDSDRLAAEVERRVVSHLDRALAPLLAPLVEARRTAAREALAAGRPADDLDGRRERARAALGR